MSGEVQREALRNELRRLQEERDSLARQLADLRTSLDYAAGQWESNAMPHTHPARSAEYRSVMKDCARDLRYALKANAPDAANLRAQLATLREATAEMLAYIEADDNRAPSITLPVTLASWRTALEPQS